MSKEQIEEMAKDLAMSIVWCDEDIVPTVDCLNTATILYGKDYRKQEWISVDERLPEIPKSGDITVLAYNGEIHDYIIDSQNRWWGYEGWSTPQKWGITHWMPLPEPPKMKDGE